MIGQALAQCIAEFGMRGQELASCILMMLGLN
jgi:hypothetical protein